MSAASPDGGFAGADARRPGVPGGRLITLEGVEGAGKSTQRDVVVSVLREAGIDVVVTREPGGSAMAERIRELLLDRNGAGPGADAELLLLFAARADHLDRTIAPALAKGSWVVCDRFTDATYAYQGGARGIDVDRIAALERMVQGGLRPSLTLLFDLPVAMGLRRARRRSAADRFESESLDFFERVRDAYLGIAVREPRRVRLIDAARPPDEVAVAVRDVVERYLSRHAREPGTAAQSP